MNKNTFLSLVSRKYLILFVLLLIYSNIAAIALPSEEHSTKLKQPSVAIIVQFTKIMELTNVSASYTADFISQENVKNSRIILHFRDLKLPDDKESRNLKIQELFKIYNQIFVSIYDTTDKKLIATGRLDSNILDSIDSNMIFISNDIALSKYHSYHITIDNVPSQTTLDPAYNTLILFVGNEMSPLLQFFLHLLGRI